MVENKDRIQLPMIGALIVFATVSVIGCGNGELDAGEERDR